jgi:hypothetical protein
VIVGPIPLSRTFDRVAAPYLHPALVSPAAADRLRATMSALPAWLTCWFYIECRLQEDGGQVDLVMVVCREEAAILAADPRLALQEPMRRHPAWERIGALCREWVTPGSPLHRGVHHIWLEFDVPERAGEAPVPGIFVSFTGGGGSAPVEDVPLLRERIRSSLRILDEQALRDAVQDNLERCYAALPPAALIPYLGVMFQRRSPGLRLCIANITEDDVPGYLAAIGWPGDVADLERVIREMGAARAGSDPRGRRDVVLHVDLDEAIRPRIGVEYRIDPHGQLQKTCSPFGLVEFLVERKLCGAAKAHGLREWAGFTRETLEHEIWRSLVVRVVNHVKLVYTPGRELEAKGYLYAHHRLASRPAV